MIRIENIKISRIQETSKSKPLYIIDGENVNVEEAASIYFKQQGYKSIASENFFWWQIAALLFWDVIFSKVEGAVEIIEYGHRSAIHPQHEKYNELFEQIISINGMPADFFSDKFYYRRKSLFRNKIKELENTDITSTITDAYNNHYGTTCRMIGDWSLFTLEELLVPFNFLDKKALLLMLDSVMQNVSDKRKGLPDLCIYNNVDFIFCEVKSENDTIKEHQKEWHEFLANTLGFKVILLLINHNKSKINSVKNKYIPKGISLKFIISKKSCDNRQELLGFLKEQPSYSELNNEISLDLILDENNVEFIFKLLELSSGIKHRYFQIQDNRITPAKLKANLTCCFDKISQKALSNYCDGTLDGGQQSPFGCKKVKFPELQYNYWEKYGYVNTNNGEWVFDKKAINDNIDKFVDKYGFCPFFKENKCRKLVDKLPDKVEPKTELNWAFISNESETWLWQNEKWITTDCQDEFPGYNLMVGIQKISSADRNRAKKEYIKYKEDEKFLNDIESKDDVEFDYNMLKDKRNKCFVATAVYGDENHPNVVTLRHFRDQTIVNTIYGKLLIRFYYIAGPYLARFVHLFPIIRRILYKIFNHIVAMVVKKE